MTFEAKLQRTQRLHRVQSLIELSSVLNFLRRLNAKRSISSAKRVGTMLALFAVEGEHHETQDSTRTTRVVVAFEPCVARFFSTGVFKRLEPRPTDQDQRKDSRQTKKWKRSQRLDDRGDRSHVDDRSRRQAVRHTARGRAPGFCD